MRKTICYTVTSVHYVWLGKCYKVSPIFYYEFSDIQILIAGLEKKMLSHCLGQLDFRFGNLLFQFHLPDGQGPRQVVCQLNEKRTLRLPRKRWNSGFFQALSLADEFHLHNKPRWFLSIPGNNFYYRQPQQLYRAPKTKISQSMPKCQSHILSFAPVPVALFLSFICVIIIKLLWTRFT